MDNSQFVALTTKIFTDLAEQIEDQDPIGDIDVILAGDVLNIETSMGTFVINRHSVLQEIWLASPISGPHHFGYSTGVWQDRNGKRLFDVIVQEFKRLDINITPYE